MLIVILLNWTSRQVNRLAIKCLSNAEKWAITGDNYTETDLFWLFLGISKLYIFLVEKLHTFGTKLDRASRTLHKKLLK